MSAPTSDYSLSVDIHPNAARFKEELKREIGDTEAIKVLVRANTAGFHRDLQTRADNMRPVKVRVEGDADDFRRKLQDRLSKLAAVKIGVTPDTAAFKRQLAADLKAENLPHATVRVAADTSAALKSIASIEAAIRAVDNTIRLDVDTAAAAGSIAALRGAITSLAGASVAIDVDNKAALASVAAVAKDLKRLSGVSITVNVDNKAALAAVAAVDTALKKLSATTVTIAVNNTAALAALKAVEVAATKLDGRTVAIRVTVNNTAALAALRAVDALATKLDGRTVTATVHVNSATAIANLAAISLAVTRFAALSATATITVNLRPPGIHVQLAALHALIRSFSGLNARSNVSIGTSGARGAIQALIATAIAIGPAIIPVAAAATAAIGAIGPAAFAAAAGIGVMALAFSGVFDAVKALGDAQSKAGKSAATAASQARQIASAQDAVRDAYRGVTEAERNLANAQRDALRAQRDITRAREEAKEALEDLDSAVKNNALSIRQAKLDLADAERELAAVQSLPVNDRRRVEAQLQYDQARQNLDDLTTRQGRLTKEQEKAAKAGVDGSEQVQAAQERAADAQERVRDAAIALTRAQEQVVASQRDLRATIASTSATGGAAVDTLAQKMAALSPAGQAFARFLHSVKDEFKQVKAAAEAGLFPGLQRGIEAMLPVLPQIALFVGRVATAMGNLFEAAGRALASPFWVNFFDYMGKTAGPLLDALGGIIGGLARGFASLLVAFTPFSIQFMRGLAGISQAFADWAAGLAGSNGFNAFIDYVKAEGPKVLKLFGDFVIAVVKLGIAFAPLGALILTGLVKLFDYLAAQSPGRLAAIAGAIGAIGLAILALTGGPVTAVVASLVAVAGAVVYAYNKFEGFRRVVDGVFSAAKLAVTTFVDAFRRGGDDVQNTGFLGAIERVGQQARRIFDGIRDAWNNFVVGFVRGGTEIQQGGFAAYMQNLGMVARQVLEWLRDKGIPAVAAFLDWIGPKAVTFVKATWQVFEVLFTVLNRVFQGITIAIGVAWTVWKAIFTAVVWYVESYMAPIFMWFWRNIIEPVWKGITTAISVAGALIKVYLGLVEAYIRGVIAPVFTWLWRNVIQPVWDGIAATIGAVWNQKIKPVLTLVGNFIKDHVAPAFSKGVEAIGRAWDGLKNAAKVPVRFVIEKVINDGIIGAFNWIAGKVPGVDKIGRVALPEGFATGGHVRGPGTGTSDSIPAYLSNGEYVIPANIVRQLGVGFFDQLVGRRRLPWDDHGELRRARRYKDGGFVDWSDTGDLLTDPVDTVKKKLNNLADRIPGAGFFVDTLKGLTRQMVGGTIRWAEDKIASLTPWDEDVSSIVPVNPGSVPGFPPWPRSPGAQRGDTGVWRNIVAIIKSTGPVSGSFGNAYRHGDPLWHGCVPMDTEILTRRGWVRHEDVRVGEDETVGYNPQTGRSEWTPIVGMHHYEDAELWTVQADDWIAEVTPGHKWLTDNGLEETRNFTESTRVRVATTLADDVAHDDLLDDDRAVTGIRRVGTRTADVWCPTTGTGTWTARQEGRVFLTGNSGRAVDWMGYNQDALAQMFMNMRNRVLELIHTTNRGGYYITRGQRRSSMGRQDALHRNHIHIAMRDGGYVGLRPGYVPVPHLLRDSGGYIPPGLSLVENRTGKDEWMFTDTQMQALTARGGSGTDRPLVNVEQMYVTDTGPDDIAKSLFWEMKTR